MDTAAARIECDSRIERVVVYARAALVTDRIAAADARLRELDEARAAHALRVDAARLAAVEGHPAEREGRGQPTLEFAVGIGDAKGGGAALHTLALSYVVGAARWW